MSTNPVGKPGCATAGSSPSPATTRRCPISATVHTPYSPSCNCCPARSELIGGRPDGGIGNSDVEYQRPCALATQHHLPEFGNAMKNSCHGAPGALARSSCTRPSTTNGSVPFHRPVAPSVSGEGMSTRSAIRPTATRLRSVRATTKLQLRQTCAAAPAKRKVIGAPHDGHAAWRSNALVTGRNLSPESRCEAPRSTKSMIERPRPQKSTLDA